MDFEFKLPDIGEGITEGEIVAWHVKEGDPIKEDDALVDVMTDKATVTISSPKSGTIKQRRFAEGAMAPVGDVLVVIALGGAEAPKVAAQSPAPSPAAAPAARATAPAAREPQAAPPAAPTRSPEPQAPPAAARSAAPAAAPPAPAAPALDQPTAPTLATPATRRLARELNVDIHDVNGTGKGGRITKEDVLAFAAAPRKAPAQAAPAGAASVPPDPQGREERTPLRGLRRRIHAKMTVAKHTAAHFHYVDEVDMTALVALRDRTKARAERSGVKLTFLPFFVKAAVAALKEHPLVNSAMDDSTEEIVLRKYYDIGIAAATEAGLVVPVVHDADRKSIYDIARDIDRLAEKARDGKLDREDVTGSTFTITSLGKLGGMFATPIVNHPEVAILGIHKIEKRPVVIGDQVVIRERMYLSSSFDHRVVDGHVGAAFVQRVKELLEEPESLLLEMA
ncbi:MAG: hypothetical protein AMXMBFR64_18580 [Myxococcales bacterium]